MHGYVSGGEQFFFHKIKHVFIISCCLCTVFNGRVGKLVYDNSESYEGEWNRGKRHGKGIYVYLNGK